MMAVDKPASLMKYFKYFNALHLVRNSSSFTVSAATYYTALSVYVLLLV